MSTLRTSLVTAFVLAVALLAPAVAPAAERTTPEGIAVPELDWA